MARRAPKRASSRRTLYIAGAVLAAAIAFLWWRNRSSSSNTLDAGTGQPGPAPANDSTAQQPSGGAAGAPGNLPGPLVNQPDPLQQQVQQTDTVSPESPQAMPAAVVTTPQGQQFAAQQFAAPSYTVLGTQTGQQFVAPIFTAPVSGGYVNASPTAFAPAPAPVDSGNVITHGFV